MASEMPKCKITVLKRTINQDLIDEYLADEHQEMGLCEAFTDGQEFVLERPWELPEGFCAWAWADIRKEILALAYGGDMPGIREPGTAIAGCSDWFRPVIFKIERLG